MDKSTIRCAYSWGASAGGPRDGGSVVVVVVVVVVAVVVVVVVIVVVVVGVVIMIARKSAAGLGMAGPRAPPRPGRELRRVVVLGAGEVVQSNAALS